MADPLLLLVPTAVMALLYAWEVVRRRRAVQAASEAIGQLRTVTNGMREGVIAYDLELRLALVNPAFERLTGFPEEDIRDQEFLQYIHPDDRPAILAEWDRLAGGGALRDQEYRVVNRAGQVRWCSSAWEPMRDEAGTQVGYLGTEFDITERKLAEDEMRQDAELFQAVLEVQQAVAAAGLDSASVMHVICERSQRLTHANAAAIEMVEGDEIVPQVQLGVEMPRLALAGSLSGAVIRTGELQRSDDATADPRIGHRAYHDLGIRSVLAVPLKDDQRSLGVLKVLARAPHAFDDRDAKALRLLAGLAGAALGHASAYESRQRRLEDRTTALQESEQRFKQLVDSAHEGVWVADEQGVITYANRRMSELLGHHVGALLGQPVYDFLDPAVRAVAQRVLTRGVHLPGESRDLRFRRKDGTDFWALVSASPIMGKDGVLVGTVGMLTDITERRRVEDQLRRTAERLTLLHDLDQAILAARSPAELARAALGRLRRLVPVQQAAVLLYDTDRREAATLAGWSSNGAALAGTMPLGDLASPEVLTRAAIRYTEDLAAIGGQTPLLARLQEQGMRAALAVPLLADGEAIGELLLAAQDAGAFPVERRDLAVEGAAPLAVALQQARVREDLSRRAADLERRMTERGAALRATSADLETLLHSMSHDLRTPLRHIGGFAQLLLDDCGSELDPAARHHAERIHAGAVQMSALVDDLLQLSRVGRHEVLRRPVNLTTLVEDLTGSLAAEPDAPPVDWRIAQLPVVHADPALVKLALGKVLENAVKFSRPRERAVIQVRSIERDGQAGVAIEDNGVGFKAAYAGKLFGMFQRLHRTDEFAGNGAGLAVVQRIAQRHGGQAWAEGEADGGATFYITFGNGVPPAGVPAAGVSAAGLPAVGAAGA